MLCYNPTNMSAERKVNSITEGQPQSPERRRFLKRSAIIAAQAVGLTIGVGAGFDLVYNRPRAAADIVLDAKEKSPHATKEEIKQQVANDLTVEGEKALVDVAAGTLGYVIATKTPDILE